MQIDPMQDDTDYPDPFSEAQINETYKATFTFTGSQADFVTLCGKISAATGVDECQNLDAVGESTLNELLACPFCGTTPRRYVSNDILHVNCPKCVSVGFHNHVRFGCLADREWNGRAY